MKLRNGIISGLLVVIMVFSLPQIVFADQDYTGYQWYLNGVSTVGEIHSTGINYSGYKLKRVVDETPVVVVVDTGVDYKHPDLENQMWINPYPDVLKGTYGYDFADGDADPMDDNGHGTHIAGIIAATQNDFGIDGIVDAQIMALKIASNGKVSSDAIVEAFEYICQAMECGVNIKAVNCSWSNMSGYSSKFQANYSDLLKDYINKIGDMGALCVFAAGNELENRDNDSYVPFCIDSPYYVVVGASDERDYPTYFSAYGKNTVDLYAPGANMLSTISRDKEKVNQQILYTNVFNGNPASVTPYNIASELALHTASELGIPSIYDTSISYVNRTNGDGKVLNFEVSKKSVAPEDCEQNDIDAAYLFLDVTNLNINPSSSYILAMYTGMVWMDGNVTWDINPKTGKDVFYLEVAPERDKLITYKDGRSYMRICGIADSRYQRYSSGGKATFCFDDFMLVKQETVDALVEDYAYLNGTSMSTPVVTGAIALLSTTNEYADALQIRDALMSCVRKVPGCEDFCKSGGVLDLSLAQKIIVPFKTIEFKKTSRTMSYKKNKGNWVKLSTKKVGNGKITLGATYTSSNTSYARINKNGEIKIKKAGIGHTVTIKVKSFNGVRYVTSKIKIKITK